MPTWRRHNKGRTQAKNKERRAACRRRSRAAWRYRLDAVIAALASGAENIWRNQRVTAKAPTVPIYRQQAAEEGRQRRTAVTTGDHTREGAAHDERTRLLSTLARKARAAGTRALSRTQCAFGPRLSASLILISIKQRPPYLITRSLHFAVSRMVHHRRAEASKGYRHQRHVASEGR